MSTTERGPYTIVTLPMRNRMRHLRDLGLSSKAIGILIADEFDLPYPPARVTISVHAPTNGRYARAEMAKPGNPQNLKRRGDA